MRLPLPEPTDPVEGRADLFLSYLDYFRAQLIDKLDGLAEDELRSSRLPSGWTPVELLKHLAYVERRWLVWGFEGQPVADPWGDRQGGRWHVGPKESLSELVAELHAQAATTRAIVFGHKLSDLGRPGPRWDGAEPASLERVLFHLLQEYARHVGHADIIRELADGQVGE